MPRLVNQENSEKEYDFHHFINTDRYVMDFHSHNYVEIYLSISGGDKFIVKDRIYEIRPRDLFVINTFDVHRVITQEDAVYERYVLEFKPSFASSFSTDRSDLLFHVSTRASGSPDRIRLSEERFDTAMALIRSYEAVDDQAYCADVLRRMKIVEMLAYVARLFHEEASEGQLAARTESHDAITPLLSYINDHFTEPLSLDALAAETGYNKFYLCKVFKSTTGITVGSYITKCRIAYAKQLLLSDCSVTDTAFRSGFHDLSHFIRTFRKETGVPPRKYLSDEMSAADSSRYYIGPEL